MFLIQNMRIVNAYELVSRRMSFDQRKMGKNLV